MCRVSFLVLVAALASVRCSSSQAAGSFQTRQAFQSVVTVGMAATAPHVSVPSATDGDLVGGCGRGRIRDSQTHMCRGPADVR